MATAKKTAVKKATATAPKADAAKVTPRKSHKKAKRVLVSAAGEQCFWVTDGTIISNLIELKDALEGMADEVFGYHVSKSKNDFADWVEYVLGDTELAVKLRKAARPTSARTVVVGRLKIYDI